MTEENRWRDITPADVTETLSRQLDTVQLKEIPGWLDDAEADEEVGK